MIQSCQAICCYQPCNFQGRTPINFSNLHKVCDLHLPAIKTLPSISCGICQSNCRITIGISEELVFDTCDYCETQLPIDLNYNHSCSHFHCSNCAHRCGSSTDNHLGSNQYYANICPNCDQYGQAVQRLCKHQGCYYCLDLQCRTCQSSRAVPINSTGIKPCRNCGEKFMEHKLKCGHLGCLGCYNLIDCKECKMKGVEIKPPELRKNEVREVVSEYYKPSYMDIDKNNSSRCPNCDQLGVEMIRDYCNHPCCHLCNHNMFPCKFCKTLCENCGNYGSIILLECTHKGCENCLHSRVCKKCRTNYKCPNCNNVSEKRMLKCNHEGCIYCVESFCKICVDDKCSSCKTGIPYKKWTDCIHKICYPCTQSKQKCRICFKTCRKCQNTKKNELFDLNSETCKQCSNKRPCNSCKKEKESNLLNCGHNICLDCIRADSGCRSCQMGCEKCHKGNDFVNQSCGHKLCLECFSNTHNCPLCIEVIEICIYCKQEYAQEKLECGHKVCLKCKKNSFCFECIEKNIKQNVNFFNGTLCFVCKKEQNLIIVLLCDHHICFRCFDNKLRNIDYRCIQCIKSGTYTCINGSHIMHIDNYNENLFVKRCCNKIYCKKCIKEINIPYHKCDEKSASCLLV